MVDGHGVGYHTSFTRSTDCLLLVLSSWICGVTFRLQVDGLVEMDEDATIRCAIQCLQAVTDFRGNEVGAGTI